jgi:hypothetical protein
MGRGRQEEKMCLYGVTENIWEVVCTYWRWCAHTHIHASDLCKKHQPQLAGGCVSMSDVTCLPIIIGCVLENNKTTKQVRSTDCGWRRLTEWSDTSHWQPPKRTGNVFSAKLQSLFTNVPLHFWWIIGNNYICYSKRRHDPDRLLCNTSNKTILWQHVGTTSAIQNAWSCMDCFTNTNCTTTDIHLCHGVDVITYGVKNLALLHTFHSTPTHLSMHLEISTLYWFTFPGNWEK